MVTDNSFPVCFDKLEGYLTDNMFVQSEPLREVQKFVLGLGQRQIKLKQKESECIEKLGSVFTSDSKVDHQISKSLDVKGLTIFCNAVEVDCLAPRHKA